MSEDTEMQQLWKRFEESGDPDEREYVLVGIAETALRHHDFSDLEISEEVHECFQELRRLREEYQLQALNVGRLVARTMEEQNVRQQMENQADSSDAN